MPVTLSNVQYGCQLTCGVMGGTAYRPFSSPVQDQSAGTLAVGSSAGQVAKEWSAPITVASGTPTRIDLSALVDENGSPLSFATVESIKVTNKSVTAGEDVIVGGGANGLFDVVPVPLKATGRGDSPLLIVTPIIVDGTHHVLQLVAAAGTAVVVIVTIFGR